MFLLLVVCMMWSTSLRFISAFCINCFMSLCLLVDWMFFFLVLLMYDVNNTMQQCHEGPWHIIINFHPYLCLSRMTHWISSCLPMFHTWLLLLISVQFPYLVFCLSPRWDLPPLSTISVANREPCWDIDMLPVLNLFLGGCWQYSATSLTTTSYS